MSELGHQASSALAGNKAWVATADRPQLPAPVGTTGVLGWMRENLFSSVLNTVLTILSVAIVVSILPGMLDWLFFGAVWEAESYKACRAATEYGACWAVIGERYHQFLFGFYPQDLYWRPILAFVLLGVALLPVVWDAMPGRGYAFIFSLLYPFVAILLIWGGYLGLEAVPSGKLGGFLLTLIIGVSGIAFSLPIGIVLALSRNSNLPIVKTLAVIFIEFIRGVPLITLLFVAHVLLNYFLPKGVNFDIILRVVIMVTLFASAYMAEVIRGGLAALPKGQYEAADALGLSYWQSMRLIILPQALKISIPGIVNTFIGLFKDTTLVLIIGLMDPLGLVAPIVADQRWNGIYVELYVFIAFMFFIFCFAMSRYSMYLERKLHTGHR